MPNDPIKQRLLDKLIEFANAELVTPKRVLRLVPNVPRPIEYTYIRRETDEMLTIPETRAINCVCGIFNESAESAKKRLHGSSVNNPITCRTFYIYKKEPFQPNDSPYTTDSGV